MNFMQMPETCYEMYRCEGCYEVCVVENPYYYPPFDIQEFPRLSLIELLLTWIIGKRTEPPKKDAYVEHYGGICEKCLKIKNPQAILTENNPIDTYRNAKMGYRSLVKNVMHSEMRRFENTIPCELLKKLNCDAYMKIIDPENSETEKKQFAKEYIETTKEDIISYLKSKTMENEMVIKKKKWVMKKEKELIRFLESLDDKIVRYREIELNSFGCSKKIYVPNDYTFMGEWVTKEKMYVEAEHYNKKSILRKIREGRAFDVFSGMQGELELWLKDLPAKMVKKIHLEQ